MSLRYILGPLLLATLNLQAGGDAWEIPVPRGDSSLGLEDYVLGGYVEEVLSVVPLLPNATETLEQPALEEVDEVGRISGFEQGEPSGTDVNVFIEQVLMYLGNAQSRERLAEVLRLYENPLEEESLAWRWLAVMRIAYGYRPYSQRAMSFIVFAVHELYRDFVLPEWVPGETVWASTVAFFHEWNTHRSAYVSVLHCVFAVALRSSFPSLTWDSFPRSYDDYRRTFIQATWDLSPLDLSSTSTSSDRLQHALERWENQVNQNCFRVINHLADRCESFTQERQLILWQVLPFLLGRICDANYQNFFTQGNYDAFLDGVPIDVFTRFRVVAILHYARVHGLAQYPGDPQRALLNALLQGLQGRIRPDRAPVYNLSAAVDFWNALLQRGDRSLGGYILAALRLYGVHIGAPSVQAARNRLLEEIGNGRFDMAMMWAIVTDFYEPNLEASVRLRRVNQYVRDEVFDALISFHVREECRAGQRHLTR